jgi:large subunit ribosomal protein L30
MAEYLRVRQVRSAIGKQAKQGRTLAALGLGKIGTSVEVPARPEIRGMLARVSHLVTIEPIDASEPSPSSKDTP